jgi:hypothetical protein
MPAMKQPGLLLSTGLLALSVAGCSKAPPPLDVRFLASDLHYWVGGQHIVIPVIAVDRPDHTFDLGNRKPGESLKEQLLGAAGDSRNPARADSLRVEVRQYPIDHQEAHKICPLLTRKWSQAMCLAVHEGLLRRLPRNLELLDRNKLELLQSHWTVGKERVFDQVKDMTLTPGVTEIGCDKESKFCTAAVEAQPGLLAVWTVWSNEQTQVTAQDMAEAQGAAVVQFVRRALGPVEDPTLVAER